MAEKIDILSKKIDIVVPFLRDYAIRLTGRELAKLGGLNHQTALTIITEMAREHIFLRETKGKSYLYSLNLLDLRIKQLLVIAESAQALKFLHNFELKEIIGSLSTFCDSVLVFGSFAQGREKDSSDLDLIIINAFSEKKVRHILRAFPREISPHFVNWDEFEEAIQKKKALALEIKKNHLIYGNVFKVVDIYSRY